MGELKTEQYVPIAEGSKLPLEERILTEVDLLLAARETYGGYSEEVTQAVYVNKVTDMYETAAPHGVTKTYRPYIGGDFMWNGQTSGQVAASGHRYHYHPAAIARVVIEEAEDEFITRFARPQTTYFFLSPHMSPTDAPKEVAEQEHLADDDSLRSYTLDTNEHGMVRGMFMRSLLVTDIPLKAWVALLRDPNNMFGQAIELQDETSALSVMGAFEHLQVPTEQTPNGPVDVISAVIPYIEDAEARQKVSQRVQKYLSAEEQERISHQAAAAAERWLAFDLELAESLYQQRATPVIEQFIGQFNNFGDETQVMLMMHRLDDGGLFMTRELAVKLAQIRKKTLWVGAAVGIGNEDVLRQLDEVTIARIRQEETLVQIMMQSGYNQQQILEAEAKNNQLIAIQNVRGGGGCPGKVEADLRTKKTNPSDPGSTSGESDSSKEESSSEDCDVKTTCPFCSHLNEDGTPRKSEKIDAYIDKTNTIHCRRCDGYANDKLSRPGKIKAKTANGDKKASYALTG
jgi:hypothetical protein